MLNPLEAILDTIKTMFDNEPKSPLHVGEVMSLWTMLTIFEEAHSIYIAALNMTTDDELIHALKEAKKASKQDIKELREFLKKEGVPLPLASAEKPNSEPNDVPLGVKLTDYEIANAVSAKIATNVAFCGASMAQSIRNDVGMLFLKYQMEMITYGASLKTLMRKRGWIKVPPYYYPPGMPKNV